MRIVEPVILEVRDLGKRFGARPVLRSISFSVRSGEIICIAGGNGAGKSTLLRCLAGLARFDGSAHLEGERLPGPTAMRGRTGYLPQSPALLPSATVSETIDLFARLGRVDPTSSPFSPAFLPPLDAAIGSLSGGQQQRVALVIAFLGAPSLLLLDEPSASLDEGGRLAVEHAILERAAGGAGVLIATPSARDLSLLAPRVLTLADGVVASDEAGADTIVAVHPRRMGEVAL